MFERCTIKSKGDLINTFTTLSNALVVGNKYRNEPLTMRQLSYQLKRKKLSEEWQAFWSNVAFYEQNQENAVGDHNE